MARDNKTVTIDLISPSEDVLSKEQLAIKKKREEEDKKAAEGKQRVGYKMKYTK